MRLTLVISSLQAGGAERVLSLMANYWAERSWAEITLLTIAGPPSATFYPLHPAVAFNPLGIDGASHNPIRELANNNLRLQVLRTAIRESDPHVVISFLDRANILTLLATVGLGLPVVVAERIDPRHRVLGNSWKMLRQMLYPQAARVVVQTEAARNYFPPHIRSRCLVIPNPVREVHPFPVNKERVILAMGRLERQKGFDLLLEAFARVAPNHPDWVLEIWGQGPLRAELEAQGKALGLNERLRLPGVTLQPDAQMARASLFVLASRYEGFPNVLCEAMACGLPVLSFDCPSGPRDIIQDGVNGVLVPPGDVAALASALDRLLSDESTRARLAARAPEISNRFSVTKVMSTWEALVQELSASASSSSSVHSTTAEPNAN